MLFCPYCLGKKEPSDHLEYPLDDFGNVADFYPTDEPNKKTLELKTHIHGCGRVFLIINDNKNDEVIACFKIPDEEWVKKMLAWTRDDQSAPHTRR
jgi:sarcosine oxidase delta subunit